VGESAGEGLSVPRQALPSSELLGLTDGSLSRKLPSGPVRAMGRTLGIGKPRERTRTRQAQTGKADYRTPTVCTGPRVRWSVWSTASLVLAPLSRNRPKVSPAVAPRGPVSGPHPRPRSHTDLTDRPRSRRLSSGPVGATRSTLGIGNPRSALRGPRRLRAGEVIRLPGTVCTGPLILVSRVPIPSRGCDSQDGAPIDAGEGTIASTEAPRYRRSTALLDVAQVEKVQPSLERPPPADPAWSMRPTRRSGNQAQAARGQAPAGVGSPTQAEPGRMRRPYTQDEFNA
jgi:hypothetical protein